MKVKLFLSLLLLSALTACSVNKPLYDKNDMHFISPCSGDINACTKNMKAKCDQLKGTVYETRVDKRDLPTVVVWCRPSSVADKAKDDSDSDDDTKP